MKNVIRFWLLLFIVIQGHNLLSQDIEVLYEQAKSALLAGDYKKASLIIADAQQRVQLDPNLDPNGAYAKKLLPRLEKTADTMAEIAKALDSLYQNTQASIVFPELPPSQDAVEQYTDQANTAGQHLLTRRDSILARYELDPEFRESLRTIEVYTQIEQLASAGIIQQLSAKFSQIASVLSDSLKSVDKRYQDLTARLEKMRKSATAGRAEMEKLKDQITRLSQERLTYMNTISEMLVGEPTPENEQLRTALIDNNIENTFSSVIQNEIKRIREITGIDSAGYKELMSQYDRVKNYNRIFSKNKIAADQTDLLAQYKAAIDGIKILTPEKFNFWLWVLLPLAVVFLVVIIYRLATAKSQKTASPPAAKTTPSS